MLRRGLRRFNHRLREKIPVLTALLPFFFLPMGIEIFFRIRQMTFTDVIQALLIKQERPFVMGGIFIHLRHRQGIDRTGFDAIAAKYALRNIDIEFAGKSLQGKRLIFRTNDFNTMRGTGRFAEVTPDATLLSIVISEKAECPAVRVRDRPLLSRILERNGTMKHMLERDLHRVPYFRKQGGLPDALRECSNTHRGFPWLAVRGTEHGAKYFNSLRLLPTLSFTDLPIASSSSNFLDGRRQQLEIRHPRIAIDLDSHQILHRRFIKVLGEETGAWHNRHVGLHAYIQFPLRSGYPHFGSIRQSQPFHIFRVHMETSGVRSDGDESRRVRGE